MSIWIIITAFKLAKRGADDLTDINPVDSMVLEDIRIKIFNLEHVNGVEDLKIRASGRQLFLEAHLSVEDHISVIHAHEITKAIIKNKAVSIIDLNTISFLPKPINFKIAV